MSVQSIGNAGNIGLASAPPTSVRPEARPDIQRPPASNSSGDVRAVEHPGTVSPNRETQQQHLEDAVRKVTEFVKPINSDIEFSLDQETGKTVVKVIDVATKEVIKQIPSEEMQSIARALDRLQGLLVRNKA